MRNDKTMTALRNGIVSQRSPQAAVEAVKTSWLNGERAQLFADLQRYGAGERFDDCTALARLFGPHKFASELVSDLVSAMSQELSANPLGMVPFRHQYQHGIGVLQLAAMGSAAMSLVVYEKREIAASPTVCFTDGECCEIVLRGTGKARLLKLCESETNIERSDIELVTGETLNLDGFSRAKQIVTVDQTMVVLRVSRTAENPRQSREYRLSDGALLHRASGDRKDSREEMFAALLGAMKRKSAVPVLANMAMAGSDQLRWQALRNCLTLDSMTGFRSLSMIASDPDDSLAQPAADLRVQLLAAHPKFAQLESAICRA